MNNELSKPVYELISRGDFQWVNHIRRNIDSGESSICDETFINVLSRELRENPAPSQTRLREIFDQRKQSWPEPSGLSDTELKLMARKAIADDCHICSFIARRENNHKKANELYAIAESIRTGTETTHDEWIAPVDLSELKECPETIETGFSCIDSAFGGGIEAGTYNILTAESNIGKTTILVNLAINFAKQGKRVLFLSFEETTHSIKRRFVQNIVGVDMRSVNKLTDYQLALANSKLKNITIVSKPSGSLSVTEFLNIPNINSHDIYILDYYVHFRINPKNDTHEEVGRISKSLMAFAKDQKKQVWTAAQVNREGYSRKDMSLTTIGKSLESVQVADTVFGCRVIEELISDDGYGLELKILKDRQGANRKKPLTFTINKTYQRMVMSEISEQQSEPMSVKMAPIMPKAKREIKMS